MATIPDRTEDAVEQLTTKIVAEEPAAVVQWVNDADELDPVDTADIDEVSNTGHSLYQITLVRGDEIRATGGVPRRQFQTAKRAERIRLIIRTHVYERDRALQGQAITRHRRKVKNWIEELDNKGHHRASRGWFIEWRGWEKVGGESGRAPTPGAFLECELEVNQ